MKVGIFMSVICLFIVCLATGGGADNEPRKVMKFLAVMNLKCDKSINAEQCTFLTDVVIEELVKTGKYTVIDRANRDKILGEVGFQQTGCVEGSCTVEAGRILGVGKIVVGAIVKLGDTYAVTLQLINVETAAVEIAAKEICRKCKIEDLISTATNAARKLMGQAPVSPLSPSPRPTPGAGQTPRPEEIKFIAATPEQQAKCGPDMVYVPAGWFMMGCNSTKDSQCGANEHPYHAVYLDAFCIDKYKYPNRTGTKPKSNNVGWNDAQGICGSKGKKLPTEAQWEKAARGTDGRVYPWGDYMDGEKKRRLRKKYNSGAYSWNIGPYGAYDMSGNLREWVRDWYDASYYGNSPNRNPTGPTSGRYRVLRGGPRSSFRIYGATGAPSSSLMFSAKIDYGFRCVMTP